MSQSLKMACNSEPKHQPPSEEQPGEGGGGGGGGGGGRSVSEETKEGSKPERLNPFSAENRPSSITKRRPQG